MADISVLLHDAAGVKVGVCPVLRPWFVSFTGDTTAALMLNQVLFWAEHTKFHDEGADVGDITKRYFIRSDQDFANELFVSRNTVRKARARLERLEFINTEDRAIGGTHKRVYYLNESFQKHFQDWVAFVKWLEHNYGYELPATRKSKQFEAVFDLFTRWNKLFEDGVSDNEKRQWLEHLHALYANNWTAQS